MRKNAAEISLGILGVSHGHPYSMSAFFNGYRREPLRQAYPHIEHYLEAALPELRRIPGARVNWIWAAEPAKAEHVAAICSIPHIARQPIEILGKVDAVIITENAAETHLPLAEPFLDKGLPLFVDRPLANCWEDTQVFWRRTGPDYPIMSCSNLRYNPALPDFRTNAARIGETILLRGLSAMDWFGYGCHLAETLVQLWGRDPLSVQCTGQETKPVPVEWKDGAGHAHSIEAGDWTAEVWYQGRRRALLQVFHPLAKTLQVSIHGTKGHLDLPISDSFTMVRRLLDDFIAMIRTRRSPKDLMPDTLAVSRILIGAHRSRAERGRMVTLKEEFPL
ncbi:MAG TPA: hypothetical protein VGL91_16615 [Acidobacteriota bacterium]|jgi:hypothetical protein